MQPRIVLLREGTDTSQGRGQLISNINACEAVFEILKTTLGPRGMDKLIYDGNLPGGSKSRGKCFACFDSTSCDASTYFWLCRDASKTQ